MSKIEPPAPLRAEERAAVFRSESAVDRSAALSAGSDRVSRKFVIWMCSGFLALGVGGLVLEHFFANSALVSSISVTTLAGVGPTPTIPTVPQIQGPLNSFLGLKSLHAMDAFPFTLATQYSRQWALGAQRGHVVVLTFYDAHCDDICAVVRAEMSGAQTDLGSRSSRVEFVAINTDPFNTATSTAGPAIGSNAPHGFVFLNGPLRALNSVWANYGVTVTVGNHRSQLAHNNICYVIDSRGRLRDLGRRPPPNPWPG